MNPEQEGSIFDSKFVKKWENSCDEAQKLHLYKAGYASYKVTSNVCIILWIVCLMADLFANVGLLPITMVFGDKSLSDIYEYDDQGRMIKYVTTGTTSEGSTVVIYEYLYHDVK